MMSTPRFFARLAPGTAQQPGAVRAALLPRFAAQERSAEMVETVEETAAPRDAAPRGITAARRAVIASSITDTIAPRLERAAPDAPATTPLVEKESRPVQTPRVERAMTQLDVADRQAVDSVAPSVIERIEILEKKPDSAAATPAPTPASRETEPTLTVTVQGPLRPQAVAQRPTSTRTESPTIVEITIDRIDVRAPKTNNVTQARPATKRAEPTQSLSDYLREREKGGT